MHTPTLPRHKANDHTPVEELRLPSQDQRGSAVANLVRPLDDGMGGPSDDREHTRRAPAWEVVIARHSEDLSWLNQIPEYWQVVVYNKVPPTPHLNPRSPAASTRLRKSPQNHGSTGKRAYMTRYPPLPSPEIYTLKARMCVSYVHLVGAHRAGVC